MTEQITFTLNGVEMRLDVDPSTPLIYLLRNDLGIMSPRLGCGEEQCGACRVLIDNRKAYSCTVTAGEAQDKSIRTLEGLLEDGRLHPIQEAFLAENAGQCGYCLSGIVISTVLLLEENPAPTRAEIQEAFKDHLCRCGAHNRMIRAVERAATEFTHG